MTAVTAPGGARTRRSLIGMVLTAVAARARSRGRAGRVAAFAAKLREHVVTAAALASADFGAFHIPYHFGAFAGWVAVGVSVLLLDWVVTGQ